MFHFIRYSKERTSKMRYHQLFTLLIIWQTANVNALVEDVIDVLYLSREVIKTISSTWELADQVGVTNEIELPFMKRKEKKILSRMAELSQEFRNTEMLVRTRTGFYYNLGIKCANDYIYNYLAYYRV